MARICCLLALLTASPASARPRGLRALFAGDAADARSADIMGSASAVVSEYFAETPPDFAHRARAFRVDALPETDELVAPFVGLTFRYPFVKVQLDGGETTKNYDHSVSSADDALQMLEANDLSYVLRFEEIDESRWPSKLVDLVPAKLRGDLTKELMGGGTTVHAYVSAAGSKALPTHTDVGDILVVQLSGTKRWTLGGDMVLDLAPGDALWLPAGLEHSARARDETSVHLTIHRVSEDQLRARRLSDDDDNRFADPDSCPPTSSSDRGCYDCGCGECNLCSDSGAFCTTSADQMTKNDPCCLYESGGDYDDDYCLNDKSETVDAWMWRTNGESGEKGKDCDWIAKDPDARCNMKGVFQCGNQPVRQAGLEVLFIVLAASTQHESAWRPLLTRTFDFRTGVFVDTVFGTIDTRGWLIREYGLDYLYENQKVYKAKKACPCACGTKDCNPCVDDQLWKAGRTIDNCKWVSKDPGDRCDVVSTYDGTKAKDFCRATCGTCGDGPAPGYKPTKKPSGPAPQCEDFGADVVDTATGEAFCERSGLDDEASCTACGKCCEWDGSSCSYNLKPNGKPHKDCPRAPPKCEDFEANVIDEASGKEFCENSGFSKDECFACGSCCFWRGDGGASGKCMYAGASGPSKDCPRTGGAQYVPTYKPTSRPDTCNNGKKDGEESDVDCGGPPPCARCEIRKKCRVGFDCETGYCEGGKCYVDDVDPDDFDECDEYYCGNDPYWRYDAGDKGPLGCDDIAAEPEKIEKRCRTQERVGVDATGREVRASVACKGVCRESCEGC